MFCSNCGSGIETGERFCGNCGTPVIEADGQDEQPVVPEQESGDVSIDLVQSAVSTPESQLSFTFQASDVARQPYSAPAAPSVSTPVRQPVYQQEMLQPSTPVVPERKKGKLLPIVITCVVVVVLLAIAIVVVLVVKPFDSKQVPEANPAVVVSDPGTSTVPGSESAEPGTTDLLVDVSKLDSLPIVPTKQVDPANFWLDFCGEVKLANQESFVIDNSQKVVLRGWAIDANEMAPLSALYIKVGPTVLRCNYGTERTDVANHFDNDALKSTGFNVEIPAETLDGIVVADITFILIDSSGTSQFEPVKYRVEVSN